MNETREQALAQLRDLGSSLGQLLDKLDRVEGELAEVKSQAGAQIGSMKSFLESGQAALLSGPETSPGADLAQANEAIQKLSVAETQEQILEIFLKEAESCVERAVLFLEQDGQYSPWKSIGFESDRMESLYLEDSEDCVVRSASQKRIIYRADNVGEAFPWLALTGSIPAVAVSVPLVFEEAVPVVFYGDSSKPIALDSLELLTHLTVLVLKNNYLQTAAAAEEEAEPALEEAPAIAPPPVAPAPEVSEPELAASAEVEEAAIPEEVEFEDAEAFEAPPMAAAPEPTQVEFETDEFLSDLSRAKATEPAPQPEPSEFQIGEPLEPLVPELEEEAELAPELDEEAELAPEPEEEAELAPAPQAKAAVPEVPPDELDRHNNEAKRFARLLVSEIKLYNEEAVEEGRANSDIYGRLQRDIDRSREMYEKRAHPAVRAREDHFHSELVRILARGQETLLGPDYTGPHLG